MNCRERPNSAVQRMQPSPGQCSGEKCDDNVTLELWWLLTGQTVTGRLSDHWPGPQPSPSLLHLITSSLCTLLSRLTSTQYRCKAAHHLPIFFVLTFLQNPSGLQGWHPPVVQTDLVDRPLSACLRQTWAVGVLYGDMVKIMDMDNVQQLQLKPQSLVG